MSGYSEEDLRRQGLVDPEGVIIQKPFKPDMLLLNVQAALVGRTSRER
jgi:hypothetical protein